MVGGGSTVRLGFPATFRVPGSDPEVVGKIVIFPGWKTMRKNSETTLKFPELETRKVFRVPNQNSEVFFPGSGSQSKFIFSNFEPEGRNFCRVPRYFSSFFQVWD